MIEKLFFRNQEGNKLCGILENPTNDLRKPMIILVHGHRSSKDSKKYVTLHKKLIENNISVFRFDLSGHGESEGNYENVTISVAVNDIISTINYLKKIGYKKIGLLGSSFSGCVSLIVASKIKDLFLLVLVCPVSNYQNKIFHDLGEQGLQSWKEKGYRIINDQKREWKLNYNFYLDSLKNNGQPAAKKIKIPTLIVHGDADTTVSVSQSLKIANLISYCKLEVISGADHHFRKPEDFNKMIKTIVNFIVKNSN